MSGELEAAGRRVPLAFDASMRLIDGDLELEATTTVDQSRFGMTNSPLRNVRRPTTLRVKSRLVREPSGFDGGGGGSGRELEATIMVDQSRFGMSDGPFRNVGRPTKLRVETRLVRSDSRF